MVYCMLTIAVYCTLFRFNCCFSLLSFWFCSYRPLFAFSLSFVIRLGVFVGFGILNLPNCTFFSLFGSQSLECFEESILSAILTTSAFKPPNSIAYASSFSNSRARSKLARKLIVRDWKRDWEWLFHSLKHEWRLMRNPLKHEWRFMSNPLNHEFKFHLSTNSCFSGMSLHWPIFQI